MANSTKDEYTIGYGKPPVETRFVKGQSGNAKGRPKGKRNHATILQSALNERVTVTEKGKRKQITKLEAVFKQVVNKAVTGDLASVKVLIPMLSLLQGLNDERSTKISNSEADRQVMELFQRQFLNEESDSNEQLNTGDQHD
jgi:hypothetical protein